MTHVHGANKMTNAAMTAAQKAGSVIQHPMNHQAGKAVAAGIAANAGKTTIKAFLSHPATLIGIGFAVGYLTYRFLSSQERE